MLKRVLVATDFTASADAAWTFAVDLAVAQGAELVLLHAAHRLAPGATYRHRQDHDRQMARALAEIGDRVAVPISRGVTARGIVLSGEASQVITETAKAEAADLLVVGSHPHTALDQILIGSVAERVVRAASCAVLVVKTDGDTASRAA